MKDTLDWRGTRSGVFSVSSFRHQIVGRGDVSFPWKGMWLSIAPLKMVFSAWAGTKRACLTIDNLREATSLDCCCMHCSQRKNVSHLLHSFVAMELLSLVLCIL